MNFLCASGKNQLRGLSRPPTIRQEKVRLATIRASPDHQRQRRPSWKELIDIGLLSFSHGTPVAKKECFQKFACIKTYSRVRDTAGAAAGLLQGKHILSPLLAGINIQTVRHISILLLSIICPKSICSHADYVRFTNRTARVTLGSPRYTHLCFVPSSRNPELQHQTKATIPRPFLTHRDITAFLFYAESHIVDIYLSS